MDGASSNRLVSSSKSSQLTTVLHPLVLLTISDYITRHTLRQQKGPIVGALLGQQIGREISVEHAFECQMGPIENPEYGDEGEWELHNDHFDRRLLQMTTVHKDRQLDLVGWYTLLPPSGPTHSTIGVHEQMVRRNESAILLGFHPTEVLEHSVGGKLPLTIYETVYEAEEYKQDGEDKNMSDREKGVYLRFREMPYSVETDETEMISMNYVAAGSGSAAAGASSTRDDRPTWSIEHDGKGKRRLIESEDGDTKAGSPFDDSNALTREEDEMIGSLVAKANAVKMLQSRLDLLTKYMEQLPPSYLTGQAAQAGDMDTDHAAPSLTVLRQIEALVNRLDLVIPSDQESFEKEMLSEANDVNLITLMNSIMDGANLARGVGNKFSNIELMKGPRRRAEQLSSRENSFNLPTAGDLL